MFNKVPARLRTKSGALKPVHLDATRPHSNKDGANCHQKRSQNQNQINGRKKNKERTGVAKKNIASEHRGVSGGHAPLTTQDTDTNSINHSGAQVRYPSRIYMCCLRDSPF